MTDYDALLADSTNSNQAQAARASFSVAVDTNPDAYAEAQRVARRTGVPVDTVLNLPQEMKRQDAVGSIDFDTLAKTAPATASLLADIEKAKLAHDDVDNMTKVEETLRPITRSVRSALAGATFDLSSGFYGLLETGFKLAAPLADPLAGTLLPENPLRRVASGFEDWRKNQDAMAKKVAGDQTGAGFIEQSVNSGFRSFGQMLPGMAATVATGNPTFALGSAGALQGSQSATKALDAGLSPLQALAYGAQDATAEVATEMIPVARLLSDLKAGAPLFKVLAHQIVTEVPTEMVATAWQNFNEWANLNQDKPFSSYLKDLPAAEAQTILATITTSVLTAGMGKGVHAVVNRMQQRQNDAINANQTAEAIARFNDLAAASKVLQRDPDIFEAFVAKAAEYGPVQSVFIDAQALMQSGVAEQVAAVSPAVAAQLPTALETGGQLAIPVEEYAARIAPTEYAQGLLDHLKTDPEGFSRVEAQQFMQSSAQELQAEIERTLTEKQGDDAFKASAEAVRADVKTQLDTVARFTPQVNDAYSTMVGNFYAVMAAKLGTTPQDLFARYPLRISAEGVAGGFTFAQGATLSLDMETPLAAQPYNVRYALRNEIKRLRAEAWNTENFNGDPDKAEEKVTGQQLVDRIVGRLGSVAEAKSYLSALGVRMPDDSPSLDKVRAAWATAGVDGAISENEHSITVSKIVVPPSKRGKGVGTAAMQKLTEYADMVGKHVVLSPSADFGGNKKRLVGFYKRFGFVENKGKNRAFTTGESMYRQAADRVLHQSTPAQPARGSFDPANSLITLLKNADLSTFLHESGHFFLEVQAGIAAQLQKEAQIFGIDTLSPGERGILADMDALLGWFGVKSLTDWHALDFEEKRAYHEQFARGFEAYLFEGKAPSIELQGFFQRFRAWLLSVYRELKSLNVELTDEVRNVFDRMLATNDQITLAEQGRSMMPLFATPEQAGMTVEEFAAYQALGTDATNDAIQDLQARGLRDMQWIHNTRGRVIKELQKQAEGKRVEVQMEVRREVMSQPIYQAWQFLTSKDTESGTPAGKLNRAALSEMYGGYAEGKFDKYALFDWKRLADFKMTADEGLHPDVAAEMFGFSSGDELVRKLAAAETPKAEIDALTDVRMLEQYGELSSPEAISRAADAAIHNDARARMVATEVNALAKALNKREATGRSDKNGRPITRPVLPAAAKEFARAMISRLKVRDIRPGQYTNAEARAARAASKASAAGDLAQAAAEKRNQLINLYATRAAYDAQDDVNKGLAYLKKFESDSVRKGLDTDYTDQIDALLERFDLRKGQSLKTIDKRAALADWIKSQREAGLEPDIPPELENEAFRKSYRDMTVEEFRGLVDTVKQIEHLGRLKHRLLTAADQRAYEAVRDEIVASIEQHAQGRQADTRTPTTNMGRAVQGLRRFWASHIKAATWARVMDGGKDGGPMWEYFVRNANERGDMETTMRADATAKLSKILAPVFALGKMGGKGQYFASINRSLNREARLAIALNAGNEGNLQRLLGGEGWTLPQILPVLQSLTAQEWAAVQEIWDHFESYRPQIADKEHRVYGKEPEWVQPAPFTMTTTDGQTVSLRGGYYPIKYDPAASQRAEEHADAESAKRQLQGAYTTATTRRSFTKARAEEVQGRPLLYSLAGLYSGVNDVIHDLAWHEWLIDTNRLLRSKTIDGAIRQHYGPEVKQQLKSWVADVAEGEKGSDASVDIALSRLRQGVSAAGLGFNVMSAVMQPLGITQSIVRVGAPWIGRGVAKYLAHPVDLTREVNSKSEFMTGRARTRFRELNELRNQVQDQSAFKEMAGHYAYFLMMRCQQMVDVPTWWGAYEKALSEGNNEDRAVSLADQAVIDAQGGGQTKDLAAIERGGPAQKLFTVFYSFMNTALNVGVSQTMAADTPAKRAKLAADYLLLYVAPAVLGYFLKNALTPGDSGDDDLEKIAKRLLANQIDYLMSLMVVLREFSDAAKTMAGANDLGRDYTGPAGLRLVTDTGSLAKQARQGEFDDAFRKAAVNVVGDLFGLPSAQTNRTITGAKAISEGKTANPGALVFGYQEKR